MQLFSEKVIKDIKEGVRLGEKADKKKYNGWLFEWQLKILDRVKAKSRHVKTGKGKFIRQAVSEKLSRDSKKYGVLKKWN